MSVLNLFIKMLILCEGPVIPEAYDYAINLNKR